MNIIYLIGFMGSGKTTVAKALSNTLQLPFIDLDEEIEKMIGRSITEIFDEGGEMLFRKYESEALTSIRTIPIVSTGGGIVERNENRKYMNKKGTVIYLQASFDLICNRLNDDKTRPLWKADNDKSELYKRRLNLYESCCNITVKVDGLSLDEQVDYIVKELGIKLTGNVKNKHNPL